MGWRGEPVIVATRQIGGAWCDVAALPGGGFLVAVTSQVGAGSILLYQVKGPDYRAVLSSTCAIPDGCRFLRLAVSPAGDWCAVGQGQSGAFVYVVNGKVFTNGIAFGQDSVAIQWRVSSFRVAVLRSNVSYDLVSITAAGACDLLQTFPISGTSQGFLGIDQNGLAIEVDLDRSVSYPGATLVLPDTVNGLTVGQSAGSLAMLGHVVNGGTDVVFTVFQGAAFEPHVDFDPAGGVWAACARPGVVIVLAQPFTADPAPAPVPVPAPTPAPVPTPTPPAPAPAPVVPVTPTPFDPAAVQFVDSPADLASWPETAVITSVKFDNDRFQVDHSGRDSWPDLPFGDGSTGTVQYTLGVCCFVGGAWVGSAVVQYWKGRPIDDGSGGSVSGFAGDWFYDSRWGALQGHSPQPGELVAVFAAAGNDRGNGNVPTGANKQRTNFALVTWGTDFSAPPIVVPPPINPGVPATPSDPPPATPPASSGPTAADLAALQAQIDAIKFQLASMAAAPAPDLTGFARKGDPVTVSGSVHVFGSSVNLGSLKGSIDR